jgi:hypothetical protein
VKKDSVAIVPSAVVVETFPDVEDSYVILET